MEAHLTFLFQQSKVEICLLLQQLIKQVYFYTGFIIDPVTEKSLEIVWFY